VGGVPALNQVLVSDERGNVVLLDGQGRILWQVQPTAARVKALGFDPTTQTYLAGDEHGTVVGLDQSGKILSSAKVGESPISALLPAGAGHITVIPLEGQWFTLNAGAMHGVGQAGQLRIIWLIVDGLLLFAMGALLMRSVTAWWVALSGLARRMRR